MIRCEECGRYIAFYDFETGQASIHYVPDTAFSTETTTWTCVQCVAKELRDGHVVSS